MFDEKKRFTILYFLLIGIVLFIFSFLFVKTMPYYGAFFHFFGDCSFLLLLLALLLIYCIHWLKNCMV